MKIEYNQKADAMYIRLKTGTVAESDEVRPGVVFDFGLKARSWELKCSTLVSVLITLANWPWNWLAFKTASNGLLRPRVDLVVHECTCAEIPQCESSAALFGWRTRRCSTLMRDVCLWF